jgi:uncharacterized protein (TIGR02246 family)
MQAEEHRMQGFQTFWLLAGLVGMVFDPALSTGCQGAASAPLSDQDREEIQALTEAYVAGWLRDDTTGVMNTLAPDAVIMPAGMQPIAGEEAIRAFWWPNDGSRTQVTDFTLTVDEIGGNAQMAWVRATGALTFTYEKDTTRTEQSSRNMTLMVLTRGPDDHWRISRHMWGARSS